MILFFQLLICLINLDILVWSYKARYLTPEATQLGQMFGRESIHWNPEMSARSEISVAGFKILRPDRQNNLLLFFFLGSRYHIINSITSLSIINRIIYTVIVILSVHYKIINGKIILFFLLFPGLILYSSIALREMIVLALMLGSAYCLIYQRYIYL